MLLFIVMLFASQANVGLINWAFQGTFTDTGGDPLAVAGDTLSINFVFDDSASWTASSGFLCVPSISESYSVTGAGNIIVGNTSPAYATFFGVNGSFIESLGLDSYFDLSINGVSTITVNFGLSVASAPSAGDSLQIDRFAIGPFRCICSNLGFELEPIVFIG